MKTLYLYPVGMLLISLALGSGCTNQRQMVVASTGTVIGLELQQNPANQSPQGKLGYNRAELALVPTNRDATEDAGDSGSGALDVPDVLMEIRFNGIFNSDAGIYQRLAVGKNAVEQPGAASLFLRDQDGKIDEGSVKALMALESIQSVDADIRERKAKLAEVYIENPDMRPTIEAAVTSVGFPNWDSFQDGKPSQPSKQNLDEIFNSLKTQGIIIIP